MNQGSQEWLEWRKTGVCASDSPILAYWSKDQTPFTLWQEKLGLIPGHTIPQAPMQHGSESEAQLRAMLSLETGRNYQPALCQSDKYPFMLASLDAFAVPDYLAEMKYVGLEYYKNLHSMYDIKEAHLIQMDHQMLVMDINHMEYLATNNMKDYKRIHVSASHIRQFDILKRAQEFWHCVETRTPPRKCELDWWDAETGFLGLTETYADLCESASRADIKLLKSVKERIKESMPHARMIGARHRFMKTSNNQLRIYAGAGPERESNPEQGTAVAPE